jgi:pimeloyl-ACP methyl ester carboxylesterase
MSEVLQLRAHGREDLPTLVYLPGLHGDWTLIGSFRRAMEGKVRFVEVTYPRTTAWSLDDYAHEVRSALKGQGIARGWLLGESFGSQVAWATLAQGFEADGLILAGGFVRHPFIWGVDRARAVCSDAPPWILRILLWAYPRYARFRHRRAPETLADIAEFVRRRQELGDREAMAHRLGLIAEADFRRTANSTKLPVLFLTGFWDPIVPWWPVRSWLRRGCPGWRGDRVLFRADHTVLATQPDASAKQMLEWMHL